MVPERGRTVAVARLGVRFLQSLVPLRSVDPWIIQVDVAPAPQQPGPSQAT
jgi:hypothetical protein